MMTAPGDIDPSGNACADASGPTAPHQTPGWQAGAALDIGPVAAAPVTGPVAAAPVTGNVGTDGGADTTDTDARHGVKMAKKKAARDRIMATKSGDKGLIIVHTGSGKGKSSSGFGMILRSIAHGMPCAVVQFIKGAWDTGERRLIEGHFAEICQFHAMGEGFTWETQDRTRDIEMAGRGWEKAQSLIRDPSIRMVLLDEINIALRYGYLDPDAVVAFLMTEKPPLTHVVLTGRNAPDALIGAADLVTEMTLIKHPFRSGIKGQPGVEF